MQLRSLGKQLGHSCFNNEKPYFISPMKMSDIRIPVLLKELKRSLHVLISVSSEAVTGVCWKVAKCQPLS